MNAALGSIWLYSCNGPWVRVHVSFRLSFVSRHDLAKRPNPVTHVLSLVEWVPARSVSRDLDRAIAAPFPKTHLVYSSSSSLSSSLYGLFGSLVAGGVGGIFDTRSTEPDGSPGLESSSSTLVLFPGRTVVAALGDVESRSTLFFGRMPNLARHHQYTGRRH